MKKLDRIRTQAFIFDPVLRRSESVFEDAMAITRHQDRGVELMREAIDLPFTSDKAAWDEWCKGWAARAEEWIAEAKA